VKSAALSPPASLSGAHRLDAFRCGEPDLEIWLKQRARKNQLEGASRTFVVCAGDEVVGYYCLAAGAVMHEKAPGSIRRNMPDPIPVAILGRLAVHADWQGRGLGAGLLKDAIVRTMRLAEEMGIRALLAHALHDRAKQFYLHCGFVESPIEPLTVMLNIAKLGAAK
jgi:GNAT superfamily N-acetyltransferase